MFPFSGVLSHFALLLWFGITTLPTFLSDSCYIAFRRSKLRGTISTRESGTVRHRAVIISGSKSQSASASTARSCGGQGIAAGPLIIIIIIIHVIIIIIISIGVAGDQVQL